MLIDEKFSALCRLSGDNNQLPNIPIFDMNFISTLSSSFADNNSDLILNTLRDYKAKTLIFILLGQINDNVETIIACVQASNSANLYIYNNTIPFNSTIDEKSLASMIFDRTKTKINIFIIFLPIYSFPIVSPKECIDQLEISIVLSSNQSGSLFQSRKAVSPQHKETDIESLDPNFKSYLKSFISDLSASLLLDYGIDPSKNIYTIGKKSSLIGPSVQLELGNLSSQIYGGGGGNPPIGTTHQNKMREGASIVVECVKDSPMYSILRHSSLPSLSKQSLQSAALILIDRL
jgi:hypothetical protein